jgi:Phytanoyl-CoA dioxygenase (PhyH)
MLTQFIRRFTRKKTIPEFKRTFNDRYFSDPSRNHEIETAGYTRIEQVVTGSELQFLEDTFRQLEQFPEYSIADQFQNSGRFRSPEIRNFVMHAIGEFSKPFLPRIFDTRVCAEETTGAFQIKPPSKKSDLNPHQDSPVIDELEHNGLFVWIPLCDINEQNGPVWVLPGSQLWGNHQRSLNVPWIFEKHTKLLWKHMHPVTMKRGDILCWDTALIHASSPNLSKETRVALTTTILPRDFRMVDYYCDDKTAKGTVEKYEVQRSFWESGDIMNRPPCPPNQLTGLEKKVFPDPLSASDVRELIEHYAPQKQN